MKWQEFCVVPEMGVTDWPSGAHAPLAGFAIQADAPLARVVGFAPLSLTARYVGNLGELQVPSTCSGQALRFAFLFRDTLVKLMEAPVLEYKKLTEA
jgi:hypothetical protein